MNEEQKSELAKEAYNDLVAPAAKSTGELVELVPRAIKAAMAPLEKWILQKEYNVAETKKLLEEKLKNVPPKLIEPPEPHIAVPALQYISYCMDNEELRNMYANLLANSMNKIVKNGVHPGFVEIIKQMCPDEAKIMRYFLTHDLNPIITLNYEVKTGGKIGIVRDFSNIGELTNCERPLDIKKYFDNLIRLGLLEKAYSGSFTQKSVYTPLKMHPHILNKTDEKALQNGPYKKASFEEGYIRITEYGKAFCSICLCQAKIVTTVQ